MSMEIVAGDRASTWARTHQVLQRIYWACERRITPGLVSSQIPYRRQIASLLTSDTRWLDLGCGHQIFPDFAGDERALVARAGLVVGIDPDAHAIRQHQSLQYRVTGLAPLPFRDRSFTLVTANMVVEHVEDPVGFLREIHRVLAPGGRFLFHTPNRRHWWMLVSSLLPQALKERLVEAFEGRRAADVYPTHYRMNTSDAIAAHAASTGFAVEDLQLLDTSSTNRIAMGPLMPLELCLVRLQRHPRLAQIRSNIICTLVSTAV